MRWFLAFQNGMWYVLINSKDGSPGTVDSVWYDHGQAIERRDLLNRNEDSFQGLPYNGTTVTVDGKPI
jgi:hypothetical protein